ncbi:MAG: hypothetical protein S4CHLAM45_03320 [Chlamydiales bacterium]|nr:hypothetical protein [Chlamydiales bacterium]MCH9619188.1 hypothetical protein [Chlamydiales bacterium]MCH9622450.1 hypothetical protein [Chlamydiales bacterium]
MFLALKVFLKAFRDPKGAKRFIEGEESSHVKLLSILQKEGRLVDFIQEDISGFSDEQVGVAVRQVHAGCKKGLNRAYAIRPFLEESEGKAVTLGIDFDESAVKVVGKVVGKPPYKGVIRHRGWQVQEGVFAPAEVEVEG